MEVVKVKPWGKGQGDYVLVNASDVTDAHELYEPASPQPEKARTSKKGKKSDKAPE